MIKNGKGGGNTKTGLVFEGKTDLSTFLAQQPHYSIVGHNVFYDNNKVAEIYKKQKFYSVFLNIDVEYIYLLDNWFKDKKYTDVLNYIHSVGCDYYFEYIPLHRLGLPVPPELITD